MALGKTVGFLSFQHCNRFHEHQANLCDPKANNVSNTDDSFLFNILSHS